MVQADSGEHVVKHEPLVAVVTPFYNTDKYLRGCIESVLRQSYTNWRYILLDNCSTDESGRIAREYAERDDRILFVEAKDFVAQIPNFNRALKVVPPEAEYVKMVLADDLLMERCLEAMVKLGEENPDVIAISGYSKVDTRVARDGLPIDISVLDGAEALRRYLKEDVLLFGSPTSVMVRADAVRNRDPFFRESINYPDTDVIFSLLAEGKLGFIHDVLTFVRMHEGAFTPELKKLRPGVLGGYATAYDHAPRLLPTDEAQGLIRLKRWEYYADIAEEVWKVPSSKFWQFHRKALAGIGQRINWLLLAAHMAMVAIREVLRSPLTLARSLARLMKRALVGA